MPEFFVPHASSAEAAERIYAAFLKLRDARPNDDKRIFAMRFEHNGEWFQAEVGKVVAGWGWPAGIVLAIVATDTLVYVHTLAVHRPGEVHSFLAGGPQYLRDVVYFDAPASRASSAPSSSQ